MQQASKLSFPLWYISVTPFSNKIFITLEMAQNINNAQYIPQVKDTYM